MLDVVDLEDSKLVLDSEVDISECDISNRVVLGIVREGVYVDYFFSVVKFGYVILADNEKVVGFFQYVR